MQNRIPHNHSCFIFNCAVPSPGRLRLPCGCGATAAVALGFVSNAMHCHLERTARVNLIGASHLKLRLTTACRNSQQHSASPTSQPPSPCAPLRSQNPHADFLFGGAKQMAWKHNQWSTTRLFSTCFSILPLPPWKIPIGPFRPFRETRDVVYWMS